jgi:hypothetical protein
VCVCVCALYLHAVVSGLGPDVHEALVHLHVSPAGGLRLRGDVAQHHGVQGVRHVDERRGVLAASNHVLISRLVRPAPDVVPVPVAVQIGQGHEGQQVDARAGVLARESVHAGRGARGGGGADDPGLLLGLPAQPLLLHVAVLKEEWEEGGRERTVVQTDIQFMRTVVPSLGSHIQ